MVLKLFKILLVSNHGSCFSSIANSTSNYTKNTCTCLRNFKCVRSQMYSNYSALHSTKFEEIWRHLNDDTKCCVTHVVLIVHTDGMLAMLACTRITRKCHCWYDDGGGGWREGGEHNGEPSIFSEDGSSLWHCQVRSTNEMKSFFLEIFIIMFDVIIQLQTLCESFLDN